MSALQILLTHLEMHRNRRRIPAIAEAAGVPRRSVQSILDGKVPSLSRAESVAHALGLELYIGPPRGDGSTVAVLSKSGLDVEDVEQPAPAPAEKGDAQGLELLSAMAARLEDMRADLKAVKSAAATLEDLAALATDDANDDARPVSIMSLAAAAGAGAVADDEQCAGRCWFRRGWLAERGLHPASCAVIGVCSESMEPTLPDGCSILVNRANRTLRDRHIYVLRGDDGLIVKRAARHADNWRLVSDHPAWDDLHWSPSTFETIGQVVWMARTLT